MRARRVVSATAMVLTLAGAGCWSHMQEVAKKEGAEELRCPAELTRAWYRAPGNYVVRGCGRAVAYQCHEPDGGQQCMRRGEVEEPWTPRQRPYEAVGLDSSINMLFEEMTPRIAECLEPKRMIRLPVAVLEPGRGDFTETEVSEGEEQCIRGVVAETEVPQLARAFDFGWSGMHYGSGRKRGESKADAQFYFTIPTEDWSPAPKASVPAPATPVAPERKAASAPSQELEQRLRDTLKGQADSILLCVNKPMAALKAAYAPTGEVQVSVQGVDSGSPEERCVQDLFSGLRVDSSASGGQILQIVRADKAQ